MTLEQLRSKRAELEQALQNTAISMERIRGAMLLVDQFIQEAEGDGADIETKGERDDGG